MWWGFTSLLILFDFSRAFSHQARWFVRFCHGQCLPLRLVLPIGVDIANWSLISPRTCFVDLLTTIAKVFSAFACHCVTFPNFSIFCTTKSKIENFLHTVPSVGGKTPFPSVIGRHAAPCGKQEASLATVECPGLGHHPSKMPQVLSTFFSCPLQLSRRELEMALLPYGSEGNP